MPNSEGLNAGDQTPPPRKIEPPNFSRNLFAQAQNLAKLQQIQTETTKAGKADRPAPASGDSTQSDVGPVSEGRQISRQSDAVLTNDDFRIVERFFFPFTGLAAREKFAALSPEGKVFVKELARFINAVREFEPSSLRDATAEQRTDMWRAAQQEWLSRLTPEQINAIADYTGDAYGSINSYCRVGPAPAYIIQYINNLDAALQNAVVPVNTIVQRAVRDTALPLFKEGEVFLNEGYTSSTLDSRSKSSGKTFLLIELPKGSQAALVRDISSLPQEDEVLLPRGSVMRVEQIITLTNVVAALPETDQASLAHFPTNVVYLVYIGVAQQEIVQKG